MLDWKSKGDSMDKSEATKRLDAIAKEALAIAKREGILYSFTNHKAGIAFFAEKYAELN
jgi:23S rRNA G2069 N7-methylase RlmK/C1962 C5-methylase RlmI